LALAAVRDLREVRSAAGPEEFAEFKTDVLAGFVLARPAAGTISCDVMHVEPVHPSPYPDKSIRRVIFMIEVTVRSHFASCCGRQLAFSDDGSRLNWLIKVKAGHQSQGEPFMGPLRPSTTASAPSSPTEQ